MRLAPPLASLVLASLAAAMPASAAPPGATPPRVAAPRKQASTAVAISLGVTVVGVGLLGSGSAGGLALGSLALYLGPSTGRWYTGRSGGGGLVLRGVGGLLMASTALVLMAPNGEECYPAAGQPGVYVCSTPDDTTGALVGFGLGATLWLGSTVYDLVAAHRGANEWNRRHGVQVTPTLIPAAGGRAPGVAVGLRF